jgi:hypothetical protein
MKSDISRGGTEWMVSAIYIAGIMCYKLGLEFFNGSITTLATDRFNAAKTFTKCKLICASFGDVFSKACWQWVPHRA